METRSSFNAGARDSHAGAGPGATDVEFDVFIRRTEYDYPSWWTRSRLSQEFYSVCEDPYWNSFICILAIAGIVWVAVGLNYMVFKVLDVIYNISYAVHLFGLTYSLLMWMEASELTVFKMVAFLVDMATFSHYVSNDEDFKLLCYYLRLHRPFSYLWALSDKNLKSSVLGTTLKFCYIFLVMRVTWALVWLNIDALERSQVYLYPGTWRALAEIRHEPKFQAQSLDDDAAIKFLSAFYLINKMYIPIGTSVAPGNDVERLTCLAIMLSGCLVVTAFAVASLALVISLYMRPEESFRARYRLIIKEMQDSNVAPSQRERVEAFYKMYWHKQRAVSATQLLPVFPPTLPATIFTDIYFEATQKSKILCDLSYQFLSELSKKMETIHYIPGDAIIKRLSNKASYIYITYGDIELVTAEDDSTAILRLTRGSVLTPSAVCAPAGLGPAHLQVRAATFCTAHVLKAKDLWKVIIKHGRIAEETEIVLGAYNDHLERVKTHYKAKETEKVKYKSSILHFKRCLLALKEAKDANGQLLLARTDVFLEIADCYIMRNRADSTLTDESDAICLRPTFPYILQPSSSLQDAWNLFTSGIIVAVCFVHPYYLVFKKSAPIGFRFFDYLVTLLFILDLYVHLSTGANVEEGVPITLAQTSAQQMRSYWFVMDVMGTAPIFEFVGSGHFAGINKLLRLPKVFRVLKALEESCVYESHVPRFLSYMLLLLVSCYLVAALQQGFMCFQFGYCLVTNLTHSPYWEDQPLDEETLSNRVAFAMYWAISMIVFTSHMETWGTENWRNVLYTLIVLEICIVLRIFMEAFYSATILVTTALREDYDAAISVVKNFMIRNQVDPILRKRFISYLQLCWYTDKAYLMTNKRSIFYDLPPHVFQDIVAKQRSKYILSLPFMKFVSPEDLKNISSRAKLFYTSANEILVNTGEINNEMYVIKQGICEVLSPDTKSVVALLHAKSHFGVIGCLLRVPSHYTIRTATNVQVFSISRKHLLRAIQVPQIRDTLEFAKSQPEFQKVLVRREAFLSYVVPDPIPNKEIFPLPRKHEPDNDFLLPFYRLGFFSILRYIFPRFTIRPDGTYLIRYEWFRATCAMASAMVFPSYSYLSIQWPWMYYVAEFLDLAALIDIFQRMLIAYYDNHGILIYHPSSTAAHYMKGAFFVDLFGCLALENLESPRLESGQRYKVTQMQQFLMMNRLIQLYRVPSAMMVLKNFIERRDILTVFKAIPLFIVLVNVLTSFMVLYSVTIYRFLDNDDWLIVPLEDKGGSWVYLFSKQFRFNLTESPFNLHLGTYFWMVYELSSTGYNTIKPSNINLIKLLFVGMLSSAMIITYFSVRIISIRANVNKDLAEFQEHMKDMVAYMKREGLKPELQKMVLDYYEYTWDKMGGVDYRNMFKLCAQITLRTDAILHIYGPTFAKCPILTHTDISLMRIIGRAVHSAYFLRGMNVVESNDVISQIYFVDYGGVDARETVGEFSALTKLPRGSVFGNLDGKPTVCCPFTFVATSRVHLLKINSVTFHNVINDFPVVKELMSKFRSNESYVLGNVAEGRSSMSQHHQSFTASPFIVTSRKGLVKYLYFKDKFIQIFLIIVSFICVYLDVYNAGFQDNSMILIITLYSLDVCFLLKILLHVTLPLIVDEVNIRRLLLPQRKAYFKGEFRYDMLSCIPIELLSFLSHKYRWRMFACLRLNRMFRIVTVYKGFMRHQEHITINLTLTTSFAAIVWFTLFVHCTSSLWYFIGTVEEWREKNSSWIYKDDGTSWCHNEYICSTYFVLTTFTQNGVGDIMPKQHSEVIFVIILQIVSTMMYMIYVGEFSNIIQYQSFRSCSFYSKYLELQEFLKNNRVSRNLVHMVNRYSLHMWRETRGMQEPHFLKTAPHALRLEIMSAAYLHHLTRHHVFENCEPAFLRQLVGCLQLMTYNEDMYVVKSSEITDSMYLIHTGKIEEIADEHHKVPRIYPAGSYFGVVEGLMHDAPYTHSYRTLLKSQVLSLRLDDWLYLLKHYPASRDVIKVHMKRDDKKGGGGGGISDDWKKKFLAKPKRDQKGRRVTVVTESLDKGAPPAPAQGGEPKRDSKTTKPKDDKKFNSHFKKSKALPPDNDEMSLPSKAPTFILPQAPQRRLDDNEPIMLQPGLWPTARKKSVSKMDNTNVTKTNLEEKPAEQTKYRQPSITEVSSTFILPQKDKNNILTLDADKKNVEESREELLTKISGSTIASDEQHMVTVDMTEGKKLTENEHEESNKFSLVRGRSEDNIELKNVEREESGMVTIDMTASKINNDTNLEAKHDKPDFGLFENIHGRSESDEVEKIERQKAGMIAIDMTVADNEEDRNIRVERENSIITRFDHIHGRSESDEMQKTERQESGMITIDITTDQTNDEVKTEPEREASGLHKFDKVRGRSISDIYLLKDDNKKSDKVTINLPKTTLENKTVSKTKRERYEDEDEDDLTKSKTITIDLTGAALEDKSDSEIQRQESNIISVKKSVSEQKDDTERYDDTNIIQFASSRADLLHVATGKKYSIVRARSSTNLDLFMQNLLDAEDAGAATSSKFTDDYEQNKVPDIPPSSTLKERTMSVTKRRITVHKTDDEKKMEAKRKESVRFDRIRITSESDEAQNIEGKGSEIISHGRIGGSVKPDDDIERDESQIIPVKKSERRKTEEEKYKSLKEAADAKRFSIARARSKTKLDPFIQDMMTGDDNADDNSLPATSTNIDETEKKLESHPSTIKDRAMSMTKGRRLIRVRYEEDKQKREALARMQAPVDDSPGENLADRMRFSERDARGSDADLARQANDPSIAVSKTTLTSDASRQSQTRTTKKKKKENKKER